MNGLRVGWAAAGAIIVLGGTMIVWPLAALVGLLPDPTFGGERLKAGDLVSVIVGGATLLLAVFTAVLAAYTRAAVSATRREAAIAEAALTTSQEEAKIAREGLEASWHPMLVDLPYGYSVRPPVFGTIGAMDDSVIRIGVNDSTTGEPYPKVHFTICLRNIGTGAAIVLGMGARIHETSLSGNVSNAIVAPSEVVRFSFDLERERPDRLPMIEHLERGQPFTLEVLYSDQVDRNRFRSVAHVHRRGDPSVWLVRQVALYRGIEPEPFAMSGPAT